MVRNKEKYDQVVSLRQRGFTLEEIAKYCEISKSTASKWLKDKPFSATVTKQNMRRAGVDNAKRLKLIAKARTGERKKRYADAVTSAKIEFANYQTNPEFVAGLVAYMASGETVDDRTIRFSHTSPELHRLFINFALKFLGISKSKIHFYLHLYAGSNEELSMKKWSKTTTIPYSQFYKNQIVNKSGRQPLHYGVGNTIIGNTYQKQRLKTWLLLAKKAW